MRLPAFKEQWAKPSAPALHGITQTAAAVVVALATVFAVIAQSKDNPRLAWVLVSLTLVTLVWTFGPRVAAFFGTRRVRTVRDRAAQAHHHELLRFARRFGQFTNTGDPSNIRNIIFSLCGNNHDECAKICSPDYMRELSPLFLQHLERHLPENEGQFLLSIQEFYGLVASYNNHYVMDPLQRMRTKRWPITNPSVLHEAIGTADAANPKLGPWLNGLPLSHQADAERRIEDFRERWVGFIDDFRQWLESISESFGVGVPIYIERPHKL
jgi:hypothetical protein